MVLGSGGGETISFGIKAIADLRGVDQTAKALTGLGRAGNQLGQGVAQSSKQASAGLLSMQTRADSAAHSLRGIAAASAGILGVGVALFKIGEGFDKALDTIRIGTGATGKALDDLGNDARAVFREVPTDLQTVATAITELNRRTGDTGKGLQELARAELELSEITKTDLNQNIADTSKLFEQWGIAVEEQVPTLDKLFRASQQTGVSVDSLASSLTQYGPILRTMGFGLDESIALLATLNKAGVNTGQVITGLRTAIAKFAASGVTDLGQALKDVFAQIKNAPDDVAAASLAIDTFGVRAGPALAENIRSGKLSYQDLVDTISDGNETIGTAVDATQDFAEKMHILRNRAADALTPLGIQMFNALNALIPAMTKVSQGAELLGGAFGKLPGPAKAAVAAAIVAVGAVAGISFIASTVAGVVTTASSAVIGLAASMGLVERESFGAAAGIARVGTAARSASGSMTNLALAEDAAAGSAVAANTKSTLFLGTLGKLGGFAARGIVIAVSLVGLELIADSIQHAIEGPQSGASQNDRIATRIESGIGGALDHVPGPIGDWLKHDADETANDTALFGKVGDLGLKIHQSFVGGLLTKTGDAEIEGLGGLTVKDIQKGAEESGRSFSDELIFQADALGVVTPQITAYKEARDAAAKSDEEGATKAKTINDALNEQIDITDDQIIQSIEARRQQEALSKAVQDTENKAFLAGGKFENWMRPFIESASDAQAEAEKLTKDEQAMIDTSLDVIRGVKDIDPTLDGTQKGFRDLGDSIVDVTRDMDDIGVLNLSPATRQALDFASALDVVDQNLSAVHESINQNNADISAWQQNISDVVDVTGADSQQIEEWRKEVENGSLTIEQAKANVAGLAFPGLDALFNAGLLSADELKSAREASIAIIQRSIGGIEDERAAQAKLLPTLKDVQDAHDNVDGSIKTCDRIATRTQRRLRISGRAGVPTHLREAAE
jgi:TP901 family phage tail tape measure protein